MSMIHSKEKTITPEEYLAREAQADYRSEYRNGELFALAGGTVNHNQIVVNLTVAFSKLFEGKPCRVFATDVRLHVKRSGLLCYPDLMVICGKIEFASGRDDTVTNPIVIVEVWSESTKAYDRGEKFEMYRQISTLREVVMVDQARFYVEHFHREGSSWVLQTLEKADALLILTSLQSEIPLATIYEKVEWQSNLSE